MKTLLVVCHNPDCRDSVENKPADPRPMRCISETFSAWTFACETCGARRAVTKDQIGGTVGAGRRDDGTGPSTGKGPDKYRAGWRHA
jgi:hypothetical protein